MRLFSFRGVSGRLSKLKHCAVSEAKWVCPDAWRCLVKINLQQYQKKKIKKQCLPQKAFDVIKENAFVSENIFLGSVANRVILPVSFSLRP